VGVRPPWHIQKTTLQSMLGKTQQDKATIIIANE
jgi:hypothetical protein